MILSAIVAMSRDNIIGNDNKLIWKLKADLKHFKTMTMGHTIIMGRKTYESIGKPLPGRTNVVLSKQELNIPGVMVVQSLHQALRIARLSNDGNPFIIGGSEIYKLSLPFLSRIYTTEIDESFIGDTKFPEIPKMFEKTVSEEPKTENGLTFNFNLYERQDGRKEIKDS